MNTLNICTALCHHARCTGLAIAWIGLLPLLVAPAQVNAGTIPPAWNLIGTYEVTYFVQGNITNFQLDITSEDQTGVLGGAVEGLQGWFFGGGETEGSSVDFGIGNVNGVYDIAFPGTISSDGMSGTVQANFGNGIFNGPWETTSGTPTLITPEPGSLVLLLLGSLALLVRSRRPAIALQQPNRQSEI